MRIFFTGGSGKAGRHVMPILRDKGHTVVNIDRVPCGIPGIKELLVDLTDAGEVIGAMSQWADFDEMDKPIQPYDAVVHFAALPRILIGSDGACFRDNTASTYNVMEAAAKLGVKKVIFASSETAYGICFAQGEVKPEYIPVDEEHPTVPSDSYAMSKICKEAMGRSFQKRTGADVYGLRIGHVLEPDEYEGRWQDIVANPAGALRNLFCYIDARDLGEAVARCLEVDGLGYEVFNIMNTDSAVTVPSSELRAQYYDGVPMKGEMAEDAPFFSNAKARKMLGWELPASRWRGQVSLPDINWPPKP